MPETSTRQPEKRYPKFEPLAETLQRVIENIKSRTGIPEYQTGLDVLDRGIFGLHKGQMTTIAARPGVGKTALACQIAMHLAKQGKKTAFLSLEMTKETILERMFCIEHRVNGLDLIMGKTDERTDAELSRFCASVSQLPIRIVDDYCHTESELYTLVDYLSFRPEVLILDHIQHIRQKQRASQYETLTEYLRYLKEISMQFQMAVVVLSQINRTGDGAPTLATLKGTGAIEEMSDHVLLMHQPEEPDEWGNNFKIQVGKNRFGPVGNFNLFFDSSCYRFEDDKRIRMVA